MLSAPSKECHYTLVLTPSGSGILSMFGTQYMTDLTDSLVKMLNTLCLTLSLVPVESIDIETFISDIRDAIVNGVMRLLSEQGRLHLLSTALEPVNDLCLAVYAAPLGDAVRLTLVLDSLPISVDRFALKYTVENSIQTIH